MTQYVEINLNEIIKVKLNDKGKEIFNNRYEGIFPPHVLSQLNIKQLNTDEDGYSEFQLHEFANIFGGHFGPAVQDIPVESMKALVRVKQ